MMKSNMNKNNCGYIQPFSCWIIVKINIFVWLLKMCFTQLCEIKHNIVQHCMVKIPVLKCLYRFEAGRCLGSITYQIPEKLGNHQSLPSKICKILL